MAGPRHRHRRAEERVAACTADAYRDLELAALAAVAEAVLADLRSVVLAIQALVGPVGADLHGANLTNADLARADLAGADLTRAILVGADLARADLTRAILVGAILYGANLYSANLIRANLYDANLAGANLNHAVLTRANLTAADLDHANLAQMLWSSGTLWPEDKASLMRERSEELRPGVWRVAGSGNADAETEGPLVPVP